MYFHNVLSVFIFHFYWLHLKEGAVKSSISSLFYIRSAIGQLNVQAATAENEEYFISKLLLFFKFSLKHVFLKGS